MTSDVAFPKPQKRIKSALTVKQYRETHKRCEGACGKRAVHIHHITSRKMGGHDLPENLLALDTTCHLLWHSVGGREWFRRRGPWLTDDVREKVRLALHLHAEEEPPTAGKDRA